MTTEKKAKELIDKFYSYVPRWESSKQCALICVDEILTEISIPNLQEHGKNIQSTIKTYINYWNEVKQEIEEL